MRPFRDRKIFRKQKKPIKCKYSLSELFCSKLWIVTKESKRKVSM